MTKKAITGFAIAAAASRGGSSAFAPLHGPLTSDWRKPRGGSAR